MLWRGTIVRRKEKRVHKMKKKKCDEDTLQDFEHLRSINESRIFYVELNKGQRHFKLRITLCKNNYSAFISGNEMILKRWLQHFDEN
jgi:hypothetical protein